MAKRNKAPCTGVEFSENLYVQMRRGAKARGRNDIPIVSIDGKAVGNGQPGPKTQALSEAYTALISAEQVQ